MSKVKRILIFLICFLAGSGCVVAVFVIQERLYSQRASDWYGSKGEPYAQLSVYFTKDTAISKEQPNQYRSKIQRSLEEASIKASSKKARLFIDAYSASATLNISRGKNMESVDAVAVGGSFFSFHPLNMLVGYWFLPNDIMKDRVVIDEELSWKLFGSYDVEGMEITINGKKCLVAGVFREDNDLAAKKAIGKDRKIFIPIELLEELTKANAKINCYEILLPNLVTGFAKNMVMKEIAGVDLTQNATTEQEIEDLDLEVVENSSRFTIPALWNILKTMDFRSMQRKGMEYPYWENIARVKENRAAILMAAAILCYIPVIFMAIGYCVSRYRGRKWTFARMRGWIEDKVEKKKKKKWEEKNDAKKKMENEIVRNGHNHNYGGGPA